MTSCVFCKLPASRIRGQNANALWIRDGYPIADGHSLIIPKRHIASFFEATETERLALMQLLDEARLAAQREYSPAAFNIGINDGPAAGQTVAHMHIHLIPRFVGDVADPRGGVRWILPTHADYWTGA